MNKNVLERASRYSFPKIPSLHWILLTGFDGWSRVGLFVFLFSFFKEAVQQTDRDEDECAPLGRTNTTGAEGRLGGARTSEVFYYIDTMSARFLDRVDTRVFSTLSFCGSLCIIILCFLESHKDKSLEPVIKLVSGFSTKNVRLLYSLLFVHNVILMKKM